MQQRLAIAITVRGKGGAGRGAVPLEVLPRKLCRSARGIMRGSESWDDFKGSMDKFLPRDAENFKLPCWSGARSKFPRMTNS